MMKYNANELKKNKYLIKDDGFIYIYVDRNGEFCENKHGSAFCGMAYYKNLTKACEDLAKDLDKKAKMFGVDKN